jgi:hypothetical protein
VLEPPTPEDDDNIMAALAHSDRVTSIDLTITSSLLDKLSAIKMPPFVELEELVLRSLDTVQHIHTLRWGTRLRTLHLTRIAFPALLEILSPSTVLVDLQLHEIPDVGYFSPEAFANALSGITQLEILSLHFHSFPTRRNHLSIPPQSGERVVLPSLTQLKYRGTSKYLDSFVARIDAPRLGDIDITFFSQPTMDASQLGRFIERIEMQSSFSQAEVQFSELAISITFTRPSSPTRLELRISCKQFDWQLFSIAQICDHFSPFDFCVEDLRIKAIQLSTGQANTDREQWLKLFHPFRCVKDIHIEGERVIEDLFSLGLLTDTRLLNLLPSLCTLDVSALEPVYGSLLEPREPFTTPRYLTDRRVLVYARGLSCKICRAGFTERQELKKHLVVMHAHRLLCPYCGDFEFSPRYSDLFREHLTSKHPGVAHADTLILGPTLGYNDPSKSGGQGIQNDDLRASVNFGAFATFKAPNVQWPESPTDSQTRLDAVVYFLPPQSLEEAF